MRRCGVDNCRRADVKLDNSASHNSCTFIGQFKGKPLETCEKHVKNGMVRSTVNDIKASRVLVGFIMHRKRLFREAKMSR